MGSPRKKGVSTCSRVDIKHLRAFLKLRDGDYVFKGAQRDIKHFLKDEVARRNPNGDRYITKKEYIKWYGTSRGWSGFVKRFRALDQHVDNFRLYHYFKYHVRKCSNRRINLEYYDRKKDYMELDLSKDAPLVFKSVYKLSWIAENALRAMDARIVVRNGRIQLVDHNNKVLSSCKYGAPFEIKLINYDMASMTVIIKGVLLKKSSKSTNVMHTLRTPTRFKKFVRELLCLNAVVEECK